jgi:hypothetical protein
MNSDISIKHFDDIPRSETVTGVSLKDKEGQYNPGNKIP